MTIYDRSVPAQPVTLVQGSYTTFNRYGPFGYSATDSATNFSTASVESAQPAFKFTYPSGIKVGIHKVVLIGNEDSGKSNESLNYFVSVKNFSAASS
jgi:hypothetical protein